jgi:hypothetical protein
MKQLEIDSDQVNWLSAEHEAFLLGQSTETHTLIRKPNPLLSKSMSGPCHYGH